MLENAYGDGSKLRTRVELAHADDLVLAEELATGNGEALAVLLERYQRLVFSIALRIVRDEGEAQDLIQTVFLEIFRKVKLFDASRGTFKVWLLRYAYTRSMNRRDQLEHRKFYSTVGLDEAKVPLTSSSSHFGKLLGDCEAARFVRQALDTLRPKQRRAIELVALEGLTLQEAADMVGESLSAVKNHYYRGMMALRALTSDRPSAVEVCDQEMAIAKANFEVTNLKARTA
jgi:RNA polymerase sigma-70 factor, ECF subfamily